jgi:Tripartite tricarboxylate transporter TctB family
MKSIPMPMTLLMLAIFTGMVAIASTYPSAAGFMPFTIGIPAIALCLIQLALDVFRGRATKADGAHEPLQQVDDQITHIAGHRMQFEMPSENALFTESSYDERETVRREIVVWGYFLGLIAGILLFGFRVAVPIFLIAFLRFQAGATWRNTLIYGGVGAVAMYLLFEKVLRVSLHAGFLTDWIMGWIGA